MRPIVFAPGETTVITPEMHEFRYVMVFARGVRAEVVTGGWFRVTRNPMYLGLTLIVFGVALIDGTLGAFLPLPVFVAILHFRFIRAEERFLEGIFGERYRNYRLHVRRWI